MNKYWYEVKRKKEEKKEEKRFQVYISGKKLNKTHCKNIHKKQTFHYKT
jgi:hypothetical protein